MAKLKNGITWPPVGSIGPNLYRRRKHGAYIVVPRARHDKKSDAQLIQRYRFRVITSILSRVYLSYIKRYSRYWVRGFTPFSAATEYSVPYWSVWYNVPFVALWPNSLPSAWAISVYGTPHQFTVHVTFNEAPDEYFPAGSHARLFFVIPESFQLVLSEVEYTKASGEVVLSLPVKPGGYAFYCYLFIVQVDVYGVWHTLRHSRNVGYVGM